jgi:hypothetical protein
VIEACLDTCWRIERSEVRMVIVPNTLELSTLWVTEAMADEVKAHGELGFETEFIPIPFDSASQLEQERLFPESHRARRSLRTPAVSEGPRRSAP